MNNDDRTEARRVAYEEIPMRIDRTPGTFKITVSPFTTPYQIATRLNITRGGTWRVEDNYIGGRGYVSQAVDADSGAAITLWQNASGRWWLEDNHGYLDLDATEALIVRGNDDCESMWSSHVLHEQA